MLSDHSYQVFKRHHYIDQIKLSGGLLLGVKNTLQVSSIISQLLDCFELGNIMCQT